MRMPDRRFGLCFRCAGRVCRLGGTRWVLFGAVGVVAGPVLVLDMGVGARRGGARGALCDVWLGARGAQLGCWAASRALAPGCAVGSRSLTRRPVSHTSAGRCHSVQRSRLGAARLSGPVRQCVWNQCTSAALMVHSAAHGQLASQAVKGMRASPESLRRATASSTSACFRMSLSSRAGLAVASVRNPQ